MLLPLLLAAVSCLETGKLGKGLSLGAVVWITCVAGTVFFVLSIIFTTWMFWVKPTNQVNDSPLLGETTLELHAN